MGNVNTISSSLAVGALLLTSGVRARLYEVHFPHATTTLEFPALEGFIPRPTPKPTPSLDVRRRQADLVETLFLAPDNTCGYVDGSTDLVYTCYTGYNCVIATAMADEPGAIVCCNAAECGGYHPACYDDAEVSSGLCSGNCLFDTETLKCTGAAGPYCNSISFSSNIWDYFCAASPGFYAATTTYHGQTDAEEWAEIPVTLSDTEPSTDLDVSTRADATGPTPSDTDGDNGDDDDDGNDTGNGTGDGTGDDNGNSGGDDSDNDNDDQGNSDEGSSTPVGAIVGGAVGGVAGLALIGALIWFFFRRSKKNDAQAPQQEQQQPPMPPQMQQSGPPQGPYSPPPGVAPMMQQQQHPASPNPQQPYYDPTKFGYVQGPQHTPSPGQTPGHEPHGQPGYQYAPTPPAPQQQQQQHAYYPAAGLAPQQPADRNSVSPSFVSAGSNRMSNIPPVSPGSTNQTYPAVAAGSPPGPGQQTIYEAGTQSDHHRGQMHELG